MPILIAGCANDAWQNSQTSFEVPPTPAVCRPDGSWTELRPGQNMAAHAHRRTAALVSSDERQAACMRWIDCVREAVKQGSAAIKQCQRATEDSEGSAR